MTGALSNAKVMMVREKLQTPMSTLFALEVATSYKNTKNGSFFYGAIRFSSIAKVAS